ncbi:hypothetical protein CGRA01v4_12241 [Colletotrichum graminicola]|uniref:Uncharacterized protein n=1 Tax=Colletotrichum graminicola (strain M1.001 / M2 / FGSC 10212) TaxID=645133 RepID=E3R0U1_COLGM|nr:uncharacterized protein GLRG_11876 [Colletotrichum graminicola M1.001]EFQ36729.1 hypothetical protein GLRG_11876 [Colletotrichum graminicola M1.001]WDK20952.1 hypothetical protein CGRA01v4_12241 [Colletotrichum graminicola]
MKVSIVNALTLALIAGVKVAEACSLFDNCRCTMADGSINNDITTAACASKRTAADLDGSDSTAYTITTDSSNTATCQSGFVGKDDLTLDNCDFRERCTAAGATGSDSLCTNAN